MSWGYKIMFVYLLFVVGIGVMVYKSSTQKVDLVTPDYYAKELKFQDKINAVHNTGELSSKVKYNIRGNTVNITLPTEFASKETKGEVLLYCPSDNDKDIKKEFSTSNGTTQIELPSQSKGSYRLQINWAAGGSDYYFEENVFL